MIEPLSFLLDSNVVIDLLNDKLSSGNSDILKRVKSIMPLISVMTRIEVCGGRNLSDDDESLINDYVGNAAVIELSEAIVEETLL